MIQLNGKKHKNNQLSPFNNSPQYEGKVVLSLIILAGCFVFLVLLTAWIAFTNRALAVRGKTYVQLDNGSTVLSQEKDENFRSDEVIRETVARWLQLTFEWDNNIPGTNATDQGHKINSTKVTSRAYFASFLLADSSQGGFRNEFLEKLGELTPNGVFEGNVKSIVRIYDISEPRQIAPGEWEVDLVSTRYIQGQEEEIKFNRTFTLQAVEPASLVLGEEEPSAYRRQIYSLWHSGLMITNIVPIKER